jgi:hypothetical protein
LVCKHKEVKRPDVYAASLPRLFRKAEQQNPGVRGLIELAQHLQATLKKMLSGKNSKSR